MTTEKMLNIATRLDNLVEASLNFLVYFSEKHDIVKTSDIEKIRCPYIKAIFEAACDIDKTFTKENENAEKN